MRLIVAAAVCATLLGCSNPNITDRPSLNQGTDSAHVMVEAGHNMELAGLSAETRNWGLARYQVSRLAGLFETDVRRMTMPSSCDADVAARANEHLRSHDLPALQESTRIGNPSFFGDAFSATVDTCNTCHEACQTLPLEASRMWHPPRATPIATAPSQPGETGNASPEATPASSPSPSEGSETLNPWDPNSPRPAPAPAAPRGEGNQRDALDPWANRSADAG